MTITCRTLINVEDMVASDEPNEEHNGAVLSKATAASDINNFTIENKIQAADSAETLPYANESQA